MKNVKQKFLVGIMLLWGAVYAAAQTGFDFPPQEISEILYSVSLARDFPIICDDTVSGTASFRFTGGDFDTAFDSFLLSNRLYVVKEENRWVVSRIKIVHRDDGLMDIDAYDMPPEKIFERLSKESTVPVVYDAVPGSLVSVHLSAVDVCSAAAVIMRKFDGYTVSLAENCVSIEKYVSETRYETFQKENSRLEITCEDGFFYADLSNADFSEIVEKMAELSGIEFCSLVKPGSYVQRVSFSGQPFVKALEIICAHADVDFRCVDELYLFFSMPDAGKKFREEEKKWFVFSADYITAGEACRLMQLRFPDTEFCEISAGRFMCCASSERHDEMAEYLAMCDVCEKSFVIPLQYIKTEDFLSSLPPGFSASSFRKAGSGNTLFYTGTEKNYERLCALMEHIDKPAEMLSYDVLIVQAQKSVSSDWSSGLDMSRLAPGSGTKFQTGVAPSFKFNIDVVAAFGYTFSAKLQAAVSENKAKIFADTTLYGVSGVPINFRNTNTYRYRDPYLDAETGKTLNSSVTREIVSGLVLDITGWISGDGMITTSVTASYSRQGVDTSSSGNPPPTSEKVVTTQVRGRSGEIIVLSGLVQNDENSGGTRTPLLSRIPIIGWFFKAEEKTEESDELTIYLIPRICSGGGKISPFSVVAGADLMSEYVRGEIRRLGLGQGDENERTDG